ncbi:MAG: SWIM zinc finger family protein [Gemmataceae bacterium]
MTPTRKPAHKPQPRTMQYYPAARLLFIAEGAKTVGYIVEETTHLLNADEHVRSYQLVKPDGTVYDVLLDGPGSQCDCIGFERRGMSIKGGKGCKHLAALAKLRQLSKL